MKSGKAQLEERFVAEIVETIRSVPKSRLRIVRDVVGALAEPAISGAGSTKRKARKSLLKTPFCGMWKDRPDIRN